MPRGTSASSVTAAVSRALSPSYLRGLGRMRLSVRRAVGPRPGNTPLAGGTQATGLELERYTGYDHGDELRFIDWNAYARLDRLYVRRFRAEREAPLHVFVDTSASMGVPEADGKIGFAAGLALSLAYIALRRNDPVRIVLLGENQSGERYRASPAVRLPAMLDRIAAFCRSLEARGPTVLGQGMADYVEKTRTPGLAVVISDFLFDTDVWRETLRRISGRGFEVAAIRPLGPAERDPLQMFHRARIRDCETGAERVVSLSRENQKRYTEALERHLESLQTLCRRHAAHFAVCDTAAGLERCMSDTLPRAGLLR